MVKEDAGTKATTRLDALEKLKQRSNVFLSFDFGSTSEPTIVVHVEFGDQDLARHLAHPIKNFQSTLWWR